MEIWSRLAMHLPQWLAMHLPQWRGPRHGILGPRISHPSVGSKQLGALVTPKHGTATSQRFLTKWRWRCSHSLFGATGEVRTGHTRAASSCTGLQPQPLYAQKPSDAAEIRKWAFWRPRISFSWFRIYQASSPRLARWNWTHIDADLVVQFGDRGDLGSQIFAAAGLGL